jgi:hypothetical protein
VTEQADPAARQAFSDFYRRSLAAMGLALGPGDAITDPLPASLPPALLAWHEVAGRSPVNSMHNRLLLPQQFEHHGSKVVFAEENQRVVVWAFDRTDASDDPEVWQGQPSADDWEAGIQWFAEDLTISHFIIEMLRHTIAAGPTR